MLNIVNQSHKETSLIKSKTIQIIILSTNKRIDMNRVGAIAEAEIGMLHMELK
jgi:predicted regulator of Ras-like GTPase activity (Roadblock/LC7/MglB family)